MFSLSGNIETLTYTKVEQIVETSFIHSVKKKVYNCSYNMATYSRENIRDMGTY